MQGTNMTAGQPTERAQGMAEAEEHSSLERLLGIARQPLLLSGHR